MPGFYATDLQPISTGSTADVGQTFSGLTEFTGYVGGTLTSTTTPDTDNFIQGTAAVTGLSTKSANTGSSIAFDRGSNLTINAGNILNIWVMYGIPSALDVFGATNGAGIQIAVGTSASAFSTYRVDGSDTLPYGGWKNYIVDLRNAATGPNTGGSTGVTNPANRFYGFCSRQVAGFKTAAPIAIDAIRYGRQILSAINGTSTAVDNVTPLASTAANFPQMSYYNDYNLSGTPQLSGTNIGNAVDGGYHRFGSLQEIPGGYLARGILRIGTDASSVYFNDANRNINFEDLFLTYTDFNRIEIRNAASTVILSSCNFSFIERSSLITSGYGKPYGNFEMHAAANVQLTGCNFIDFGTFIFQSSAVLTSTTFRRCGLVTANGASFTECLFVNSKSGAGSAAVTTSNLSVFSNCRFDGTNVSNHAVLLTSLGTGTMSWNSTYTGYATSDGSTGSEVIYVNVASGSLTINYTGVRPSVRTAGATVTLQSSVTNTITVLDTNTDPVANAVVAVYQTSNDSQLANGLSNASGIVTFGTASGVPFYVRVRKSTSGLTRYIPVEIVGDSGTGGANITVTLVEDVFTELTI